MTKRIALSMVLLAALTATGCGAPAAVAPNALSAAGAEALAKGGPVMAAKPEDGNKAQPAAKSALGEKTFKGTAKKPAPFKVAVPKVKQALGPNDVISICSMTLRSMDAARSWDSGANIGYTALDQLKRDNGDFYGGVFGMTDAAARGAGTWEEAYKIIALGLDFVAKQVPYKNSEYFALALKMMDTTKTWDAGAKVGYAVLDYTKWLYQDSAVGTIAKMTRQQAESARTWEDAYKTIQNGLQELSRQP